MYKFNRPTTIARRISKRHLIRKPQAPKHLMNEKIIAPELRVVDSQGEMMGILSREDALAKAKEQEVDLVIISPKTDPPVAKIIDYGKMLYSLKKTKSNNQQKKVEIKGIRITFRIGEGDLERQRSKAEVFLLEGNTVRVQMTMRGRERAHTDMAIEKMKKFLASLEEISKVDQEPKGHGFQIVAIIKPTKTKKHSS